MFVLQMKLMQRNQILHNHKSLVFGEFFCCLRKQKIVRCAGLSLCKSSLAKQLGPGKLANSKFKNRSENFGKNRKNPKCIRYFSQAFHQRLIEYDLKINSPNSIISTRQDSQLVFHRIAVNRATSSQPIFSLCGNMKGPWANWRILSVD